MKSVVRTETRTITSTWWDCDYALHRHLSEALAEACIAGCMLQTPARNQWTAALYQIVLKRRDAGETCATIGADYNVTGSRMAAIMSKAVLMRRHHLI